MKFDPDEDDELDREVGGVPKVNALFLPTLLSILLLFSISVAFDLLVVVDVAVLLKPNVNPPEALLSFSTVLAGEVAPKVKPVTGVAALVVDDPNPNLNVDVDTGGCDDEEKSFDFESPTKFGFFSVQHTHVAAEASFDTMHVGHDHLIRTIQVL